VLCIALTLPCLMTLSLPSPLSSSPLVVVLLSLSLSHLIHSPAIGLDSIWLIPFDPHEKLPDQGLLKLHCVQAN
jgi:hypothetical protein